jgi:hypothetical protein
MAGLEGRSREFRVLHDGLPRFNGPAFKSNTPAKSAAVDSKSTQATAPSPAPAPGTPDLSPTAAPTAPSSGTAPGAIHASGPVGTPAVDLPLGSAPRPRPPSPPARPVVRRSRAWRWFGWFRQRPVGHGKPEQIELRLEDVRPVRSTLEGEDFMVVEHQNSKPVTARRNPFAAPAKTAATGKASEPAPGSLEPVSEAPRTVPAETNGPMNRVSRWFRNRETTAHK